ncbi:MULTISPECIES: PIN domain-containing protein [unclassified Microcoleus]|uniref:PIN domain-containing protein n=1 Tax=unclassified Microcoleus TaxID=2642155 RepID=UPI00312B6E37
MKEYIHNIFNKYRKKGVIVDTNILVLWFVGSVNRSRISQFNRTEKFAPEDYDLLVNILSNFGNIITTPNILTEVNSLLNQIGEPERSECLKIFAQGIKRLNEVYIESLTAVQVDKFTKFGLTDVGIIYLGSQGYLVLTDDLKLASYLQKIGIDTINFNNIRTYGW